MIYLYWPGKQIPEWLLNISFYGQSTGIPRCVHRGFGFVVRRGGKLHAYNLSGTLLYIDGKGMNIRFSYVVDLIIHS